MLKTLVLYFLIVFLTCWEYKRKVKFIIKLIIKVKNYVIIKNLRNKKDKSGIKIDNIVSYR